MAGEQWQARAYAGGESSRTAQFASDCALKFNSEATNAVVTTFENITPHRTLVECFAAPHPLTRGRETLLS